MSLTSLRVYVASSWRNALQSEVVSLLREDGHEVYDFREPTPGNRGFSWHGLDPSIPPGATDPDLVVPAAQIQSMLKHPIAEDGFAVDMAALEWCEACVLVLPCGRSAHLEAGWASGAGRFTAVLLADGQPDLMHKMCHRLCVTTDELRRAMVQASGFARRGLRA